MSCVNFCSRFSVWSSVFFCLLTRAFRFLVAYFGKTRIAWASKRDSYCLSASNSSTKETAYKYGRLDRCINQWYCGGPNPRSEPLFVLPIQRRRKENKTNARQKNRGAKKSKKTNRTEPNFTSHLQRRASSQPSPVYLSRHQQSCPKQIATVADLASAVFLRKYGPIQRPFSRYRHELC